MTAGGQSHGAANLALCARHHLQVDVAAIAVLAAQDFGCVDDLVLRGCAALDDARREKHALDQTGALNGVECLGHFVRCEGDALRLAAAGVEGAVVAVFLARRGHHRLHHRFLAGGRRDFGDAGQGLGTAAACRLFLGQWLAACRLEAHGIVQQGEFLIGIGAIRMVLIISLYERLFCLSKVNISLMRAVIQRVSSASVTVDGQVVGQIGPGFLVLLGITHADGEAEAALLARKIAGLRVFEDDRGKMNLGLADVGGSVLAVSQFTLYADLRKGRRPSFIDAARPEQAEPLYQRFCQLLANEGIPVEQGVFQAHMQVALVNDGPVTIWLDTVSLAGSG